MIPDFQQPGCLNVKKEYIGARQIYPHVKRGPKSVRFLEEVLQSQFQRGTEGTSDGANR
mgnify:CR=1 FL=1